MTDLSERMNSRISDDMQVDFSNARGRGGSGGGSRHQPKKQTKRVIMSANTTKQKLKQPSIIPRSGSGILSISKVLFGSGRPSSSSSRHRSGKSKNKHGRNSRTTKNRHHHQIQNPTTTKTMIKHQRTTIPSSTIDKELQWISREYEGPRDPLKDILSSSKTKSGDKSSSTAIDSTTVTTTTTATKVLSKKHKKKKKSMKSHKRSSSYNRERFHPQLTFIEESSESEEDDDEDQQSRDGSESGSEAAASSDESLYIEDDLSSNATTITNTSGSSGSRSSGCSSSKQFKCAAIVNGVYNFKQYRDTPEDSTDDDDIYIEKDDSSSSSSTTTSGTSASSGSSSGCSDKSPLCREPETKKFGNKNLDSSNIAHSDKQEMEIEYFSASEEEHSDSSDDDDDDDVDTLSSRSTTSTSSQRSTSPIGSSGSISSDGCLELVDETSQSRNVSEEDAIQRQVGRRHCCQSRNMSQATKTRDLEPDVHLGSQHRAVASQDSQDSWSVWKIVYLILSIVLLTILNIVKFAACPVKAQLMAIHDRPPRHSAKKGGKKRTNRRTGRAKPNKENMNTVDTGPYAADWESILASSSASFSLE